MQLDLNYVRLFVAVVDGGSFASGARAMSLPTSNVSRHVARLEAQVGARLLERTTRTIRLTEAGRLLHARAKQLVTGMADLEVALLLHQTSFQGEIDIGVPSGLGAPLGAIIAQFCKEHPRVECRVHIDASDPLHDDLDLAITFRRGPAKASSMISKRLASLRSCVVAAPTLIASCGMPTRVSELTALPCISTLTSLDGAPWRFLDAAGRLHQLTIPARYRVDSADMARAACLRGVGFAVLADVSCRAPVRDGQLVRVPLDLTPAPLEVIAVYPHRHRIPKVRALLARLGDGIAAALA
jgi:DNA-binding transcriptional LysR family regulator